MRIRTKNIDDVIVVPRSRKSIRGFIKLVLGINDTPYWFHQTLTFKDCHTDAAKARIYLNGLLDLMRKKHPLMPALYVEERQKRLGLHCHVIFMLFGKQSLPPKEMRRELVQPIFARWNKINDGKLEQIGNWLTLPPQCGGLRYLLKGVKPTGQKTVREHWYGVRQGDVIRANSHPVSRQDVRKAWERVFKLPSVPNVKPALKPARVPAKKHHTMRNIDSMKSYLEWTGAAMDFETFKRIETGRKGKVSDTDYLKFLNGQNSEPEPDRDTL